MTNDLFDNQYFIDSNEAIELIESFFNSELPELILKNKFDDKIYWNTTYSFKEVEIKLGGGRGFFEHSLKIDGKEFPLSQFDKRIDNVEVASKKNILFVLNILKMFFKK